MPTSVLHLQAEEEDAEIEVAHILKPPNNHKGILSVFDITRCSHINHLIAVTAYVFRLVHNLQAKLPKTYGPLTSRELSNAHRNLVKIIQCLPYPEELA